jgi:hypothetical protein
MKTLILYVPRSKTVAVGAASFQRMFANAIGEGYAIASTEVPHVVPGRNVVLLDIETKQRAEGKLRLLTPHRPDPKTNGGMLRYDVHIDQLKKVQYAPPPPISPSQKAARYRGIQFVG